MTMSQEHREAAMRIAGLRAMAEDPGGILSPQERLTARVTLAQAEALLAAAETVHSAIQTLVHDGIRPLMGRRPPR